MDENEALAGEIEQLIRSNAGLVVNFAASGDDESVNEVGDDSVEIEMDAAA
ncbi:MAG: hypothetical protein R2867_29085 [Caldilineaceae bacterium]